MLSDHFDRGTLRAPGTETLDGAAAAWLSEAPGAWRGAERDQAAGAKPATLRNYDHHLMSYVKAPAPATHRLAALARRDVQRLVDQLVAKGGAGAKVRQVL